MKLDVSKLQMFRFDDMFENMKMNEIYYQNVKIF